MNVTPPALDGPAMPGGSLRRQVDRWLLVTLGLALCGLGLAAQPLPSGRWEGQVQAGGQTVEVVLDLPASESRPRLTVPGRSAQELPLSAFVADGGGWRSRSSSADGNEGDAAGWQLHLRLAEGGTVLAGELHQGGHTMPLRLLRTGDALRADSIAAAPLPASATGVWRGRYDMGLGPREVTLTIAAGGSTLVIVGRRRTELALDEAVQRGQLWMLRAAAADISLIANAPRTASETLRATIRQGPFEAPLELRREVAP
jgi:hypothetical protein